MSLSTRTSRWRVLDYAWDPASSPAPVVTGPLGARRATAVVDDLMGTWSEGGTRRNLLIAPEDRNAFPFEGSYVGYVAQPAHRSGGDWVVPVAVYGRRDHGRWWRQACH